MVGVNMNLCNFKIGINQPLFLIAGPCVVESEQLAIDTAGTLKSITDELGVNFIYKSSFAKANRTSKDSFTGLGVERSLKILSQVKQQIKVPVLTDVHTDSPLDEVASVVDVLQTPALLCRQTDFIMEVAATGLPVNIKKGQFLAPWDMDNVVAKAKSTGNQQIMVCERGTSFGYNYLVSDFRSLVIMRNTNCPVIFDAGHSVQLPGGMGRCSAGQSEFIPDLARAAAAVGVAGIFIETHPNPEVALCDGPNSLPLDRMRDLLQSVQQIDRVVKGAAVKHINSENIQAY